MSRSYSFAQICDKANGTKIVQVDQLYMSQELALAIGGSKTAFNIHRKQLRATQDLIVSRRVKKLSQRSSIEGVDSVNDSKRKPVIEQTPFNIMGLPFDVRHMIIEQWVERQTLRVFRRGGGTPIRVPKASQAGSTQLRRECLLVALKMCTIEIHSGPGNANLRTWLSNISFAGVDTRCVNGYDAIHSLFYPYFSRFPYGRANITTNNDVLLARTCKNLRAMSIDWHPAEVARVESEHDHWSDDFFNKSAASLVHNYQLEGILEAAELRQLKLCAAASGTMEALKSWFEKEFEKRNHKVIVEIGYN